MPDDVASLNWTEEQWASVNTRVKEMAAKARVASSCLPLVGPLPPGQASVSAMTTTQGPPSSPYFGTGVDRLDIDEADTLRLTTLAVSVYLRSAQVQDPHLTSALQLVGRAADIVGRLEDAIIFRGQPNADQAPPGISPPLPAIFNVLGGQTTAGLLATPLSATPVVATGPQLVEAVSDAIQQLEDNGHFGPFACILGHELYEFAVTPVPAIALPRDSILPFLEGGCLRRCSVIPRKEGVVVALGGNPIDLVVANDVHVQFLQVSIEPRYVLRVCERFVLRIKEQNATCLLKT